MGVEPQRWRYVEGLYDRARRFVLFRCLGRGVIEAIEKPIVDVTTRLDETLELDSMSPEVTGLVASVRVDGSEKEVASSRMAPRMGMTALCSLFPPARP